LIREESADGPATIPYLAWPAHANLIPDRLHPSDGGGLRFSPLVRTNTHSLSVAGSSEETLAYMRFGFHD